MSRSMETVRVFLLENVPSQWKYFVTSMFHGNEVNAASNQGEPGMACHPGCTEGLAEGLPTRQLSQLIQAARLIAREKLRRRLPKG